jgi:hypothetical protein
LVNSIDENKLKQIKDIIETKFNIAIKSNWSILLNAYFEEIMRLHGLFIEKILDLQVKVKNDELLEGHCDLKICRGG